jgi:hypothetical protein
MASLNHGVSFSTVSIQPLIKNIRKRIQERRLVAAAELPQDAGAIVSRGGRPDLAGDALPSACNSAAAVAPPAPN